MTSKECGVMVVHLLFFLILFLEDVINENTIQIFRSYEMSYVTLLNCIIETFVNGVVINTKIIASVITLSPSLIIMTLRMFILLIVWILAENC